MPGEVFPVSSPPKAPKSIYKAPKQQTSLQLKRVSATIQARIPENNGIVGSGPQRSGMGGGEKQLPTELLMTILNFIHDDKETMRTCCIVSKSWLPCARYFLITNKFSLTELNVGRFISLLSSPHATIGAYIYHLAIHTQQYSILLDQSLSFINDATSVNWMRPALSISACLHYIRACSANTLRSLTLHDIGPLSLTDFGTLSPLLRSFSSLTRLELSQCLFSTIQEFFAVICARPNLRRLVLTNIMIQDEDETITSLPVLQLPRRLSHITLQTAHQSDILEWILGQPFIPALTSLSLGGIGQSMADQEITGRFLMSLGAHLKHLKIYLNSWSPAVTLSHNTCLQTFSVSRYRLNGNSTSDTAGFPGLLTMLDQISSRQLTQITLRFVNNPEDLDVVPWHHLERLFQRPQFTDLKSLRIRCVGRTQDMRRLVQHMFPRLSHMGIVQFRCDSDSDNEEE
ncbi:hypothetical protein BDN70DRAFT_874670 [Pholiota conissans]|uniref:F-box domain-containing protein n=1 Tax=Pholiota conissans TaxID=109636 RepID=A0A9P6D3P1_9AGAR|nr:hypothetical protein BDN70DRAFT_874670 [Pholiota conissans]